VFGVANFLALHFRDRVIGTHVADEAGHATLHARAAVRLADALAVLAVAAVGQPRASARIPEIAGRCLVQVAVVIVVYAGALGVRQRPIARDVVSVVGHCGPGMAVARHMAVAVKVVQQNELLGEPVVVGGDLFAKQDERRIPISLLHVAEDLIVGAILLN